jgi:hypothetical protein
MVAGLKSSTYADKLKEVGLARLEERWSRDDIIQTFRIVNVLDNVEEATWFTMASEMERDGANSTRDNRDTTRLVEGDSRYERRRNFSVRGYPVDGTYFPRQPDNRAQYWVSPH